MTTGTLTSPTTTTRNAPLDAAPAPARVTGMACRNCGLTQPIALAYVCPACFGPLEVTYDLAVVAATLTHETIARRAPGIWRYLELLPVDAAPARSLPVGSTPLLDAARLAPTLGVDKLWLKDDTRNPSLSFKDRAVAIAAARAVEFGVPALACASTGNLAGATAAAAAAVGLPAYVFIPADLEPAKVDHALAYGATVVPIDGTYDDVNRLCLEVADETGWGFVNINLRPFYAEGSKTLAYEIAESLGWRTPDVIVGPVASGAMFTRVARGFEELA
ncbi:MAG: threonine synthase, partial [Chloroflexota bacterium]|nr:threonine synthase [Chloroflexota bacterium]